MDIRASGKQYKKLRRLYDKSTALNKNVVSMNEDPAALIPVVMVQDSEGHLIEWTKGMVNVNSLITKGYVEIKRNCPHLLLKKCRTTHCGFYVIKDGTGDCMLAWLAAEAGIIQ